MKENMMIAAGRQSRDHSKRKGVVAVEFALTAPVLFLVFFAMIEFARFNMIRHGIDSAVYEGARRGIVPGATVDDVKSTAETILRAVSTIDASVTVVPAVLTPETTQVTVTATVPYNSNGWVVLRYFQGTTLTRSCTLARERLDAR